MNKSTAQPARIVARCSESSCISTYTAVARPILGLAPSGLALRFAPGETVLRAVRLAGVRARYDFFASSEHMNRGRPMSIEASFPRSLIMATDQDHVAQLMAQREQIEAPCNSSHYRILKRIASNPDNYLAIGFGAGSAPGLAGNLALAGLLTELGLRPFIKEIWGVSVGAIVGGGWSTGLSADHMLSLADELDRKGAVDFARWEVLGAGLVRLLLFKQLPDGLVRGRRFRKAIERGLPVQRFEDCEIPFRAIACTDDGHAQKIIFRQGPLINAITASMCIPGVLFPIADWNGREHGYFDGAVVEKTPLPSIIEEHHREGRKSQLVVICTHFSDSGRITKPVGFIQRMLNAMHHLEDEVWEYQALKAREASNCKFLVLNPHMKEGTAFDFSVVRFNYLWARKMFKEQLSNAKLAIRFEAR